MSLEIKSCKVRAEGKSEGEALLLAFEELREHFQHRHPLLFKVEMKERRGGMGNDSVVGHECTISLGDAT